MTPDMVQKVALQGGLVAGVGASLMVLRKVMTPKLHACVAQREGLAKEHPALASTLSEVAHVATSEQLQLILDAVDDILRHDRERKPSSQWHISRANAYVLRAVKQACSSVGTSSSDDERFRQSLHCETDTLPLLQGQLDDLLHNHLLSFR